MLVFSRILETAPESKGLGDLPLDHAERRRARLQAQIESGPMVGLAMPRGATLNDGTILSTTTGEWCVVRAKEEAVSVARTDDMSQLARAAYHLGNRHVAVQLEPAALVYLSDPHIDELCVDLGLGVEREIAPFNPEKLGQHVHSHEEGAHPVHSSAQLQTHLSSQAGGTGG
jgi:urease accessory protein